MRRALGSLQLRLIIGFALVLALSLGSVSAYARYTAAQEVDRFEDELISVRDDRVERYVSRFLREREHMDQLRPFLEQAGSLYGVNIVVTDGSGLVVGETEFAPDISGFFLGGGGNRFPRPDLRIIPVEQNGDRIGAIGVQAASAGQVQALEPRPAAIVAALDGFLLWTGLGAGIVGIAIVAFLARRTLAPLRALESAATSLGSGDLSQRVPVRGTSEIGRLATTFNAMAEGLEHAERQRRSLMADIAHELRTPLANVQGYVEAMRDGLAKPDEQTLDTLHGQVLQLAHLLEDLRVLALADAGALRLSPELDSLGDLARSSVDAVRPRAEAKGISLSFASADVPLTAIDRARMGQVVGNLLENAIAHTPASGSVRVSVSGAPGVVRLEVADTGPGIPEEELERVFERFHRLDPSRARATGGTGLGLAIARQLIEAHGGRIWAESVPDEGSTFMVELPASDNEASGDEEKGG